MNYSNDCKSKWRFGSNWLAIIFALLSVVAFSCDDESEPAKELLAPSDLRYASVTEVYEGKVMESAIPVVFSDSQPIYVTTGGTAEEGGTYVDGMFTVKDSTGVIRLAKENQLTAGLYKLDIKVTNKAGETVFPGAFELRILPSAIEALQYTPYTQMIVRGLDGQKTSIPVFKGSKPASFALTEESDFTINPETGEISLALNSDIDAGNYKLSVKVTNVAAAAQFDEVITVQVQTKAYGLVYTPQEYLDVQQKQAKQSAAPAVQGTAPFTFSLKDNLGAFTIDENTGVISLPVGHALDINTYKLTVVATNVHGSTEFANAASFQIVEIKAILPSDLLYAESSYSVNYGKAFESVVPTVSGSTPISFSLVDNKGAFVIDETTGVISLTAGNTLAEGEYLLSVKAANVKGEVSFPDVITVTVVIPVPEVVFEDGWDNLTPAAGETRLGNMIEFSGMGDPIQASNNKWNRGWGNWTVADQTGTNVRGAVMIPQKTENDDWLIAEVVDLTDYNTAVLTFAGYSKYGVDASTLKLLVSENYSGDVNASNWVEVDYTQLPTDAPSQDRTVDLSQFDGKGVTVALRHESKIADGVTLDNLSRTHFILHFEVKAIHK